MDSRVVPGSVLHLLDTSQGFVWLPKLVALPLRIDLFKSLLRLLKG
jgi:hypothetical protein